jgi:hypothetical protein
MNNGLAATFLLLVSAPCLYAQSGNLIPDASFESPIRPWFAGGEGASVHIDKRLSGTADHGRFVLAVLGWASDGSVIRSPVIDLGAAVVSAGVSVRSYGDNVSGKVELALLDENGERRASLGSVEIDGKGMWSRMDRAGQQLDEPLGRGRLVIIVSGPHKGMRVEIDRVGLFRGDTLAPIDGRFDFTWFEAEQLADGKAWKARDHFAYWYKEYPNGGKMIDGAHDISDKDNQPVRRTVNVNVPGPHKLWWRMYSVNSERNSGRYTIALRQHGRIVAEKQIHDGSDEYPRTRWTWDSIEVQLDAGRVELVLSRPAKRTSWIARKVDLFVLTDRVDYEPDITDLRPRGYLRFTNESQDQEPFCPWIIIRRHRSPWYAYPGILSLAGTSGRRHPVPADKSKWLGPGDTSPWINISQFLLPAGGRNNVYLYMTRKNHASGFVEGRIRGTLEFATGDERRIVKRIVIDQDAPRVPLSLPYDFENLTHEIRSPDNFIREKEKMIDGWPSPQGAVARHLDLSATLSLIQGQDPTDLVTREIAILRAMGFNNTFDLCAPPATALRFYQDQQLQAYLGLSCTPAWVMFDDQCPHRPQTDKIERLFTKLARQNEPILGYVNKLRVMDEPAGPSFEHQRYCATCRQVFADQLKHAGITPKDLGVDSWEKVVPVTPADMADKPALYYHSAMFRLRSAAAKTRVIVQAKRRHLPDTARTYVNLMPQHSGYLTWVARGTDPFLLQREGGLELGWFEDWLGYGAHARHAATSLAMIGAAGHGRQPLGMYVIGESGGARLLRMKYYLAVAHGARHINVYNYGPWYASIDSWSRDFDLYPVIAKVQREMAVIDPALHGTTRYATSIAIVYNRTASIWADRDGAFEHDGRYIHWALAHGGYSADFISEQDVQADTLDRYRVLYLTGAQLREPAARRIAAWVRAGGVLMGTAGAGSRNQYNQPMDVLNPVFGGVSAALEQISKLGRPRYELRTQKTLDELTSATGSEVPAVTFKQLCYRESLRAMPGAEVVLTNRAGEAAGLLNRYGRGKALRIAGLPGIAYLSAAMTVEGYDPETCLPPAYPAHLRELLMQPCRLAGVEPVATFDDAPLEVVRYDATGRIVLFVLDHLIQPRQGVTIYLRDARGFHRARSAAGQEVQVEPQPRGALKLMLPLHVADALVLEPG